MKTMYKVLSHNTNIEPAEVIRYTDKSVWIIGWRGKEQRHQKRSTHINYFDTWEEAHDYLVSRYTAKVKNAESSLTYEREKLNKVLALSNPGAA